MESIESKLHDPERPWRLTNPVRPGLYERLYVSAEGCETVTSNYWTGKEWRRHQWNRASRCDRQDLPHREYKAVYR